MKKIKKISLAFCVLALLLSAVACTQKEPTYEDRETFAKETYIPMENTTMTFLDGIIEWYGDETPAGRWFDGCSAPDRDDQFDAYVLRHEAAAGEHTTFTYLIYYPHGDSARQATPELLEGERGYVLRVTYTEGTGINGYSLCYLSVTLPTDQAPRLDLLEEGNDLGYLSTVTVDPIPLSSADQEQ